MYVSWRRHRSYRGEADLSLVLALLAAQTLGMAPAPAAAVDLGGQVALTSDAIYRGVTESSGRPAAQVDVHATTAGGTFAGVTALGALSTAAERYREPGSAGELGAYVGQRFALGESWSAQLSADSHFFMDREHGIPGNYQEIGAQISYLDLWSISLTAIPDAPRPIIVYPTAGTSTVPGANANPGHYLAWVAASQVQWGLTPHLFLTAGAGYYFVQGKFCYYGYVCTGTSALPSGYAYGSAGLAYQWQHWRLDVGYFITDSDARQLYPFPIPKERVAGTLSWSF